LAFTVLLQILVNLFQHGLLYHSTEQNVKKLHKISKIYKFLQTQDLIQIRQNFPRKPLISIIYIFEEKGETPKQQN
jgi:hypothetical protein